MTFWLDLRIFGNGFGLGAPYFDQRFYWLSGRLYTWIGGHGAQLQSFQWTHPRPGETRKLAGREYHPFQSSRRGLRVRVSWATTLPRAIGAANAELRAIRERIGTAI